MTSPTLAPPGPAGALKNLRMGAVIVDDVVVFVITVQQLCHFCFQVEIYDTFRLTFLHEFVYDILDGYFLFIAEYLCLVA